MPTESRFAPTRGASALVSTELAAAGRTTTSVHVNFVDGPKANAHLQDPEKSVPVETGGYASDVPVTDHERGSTATRFHYCAGSGTVETRSIVRSLHDEIKGEAAAGVLAADQSTDFTAWPARNLIDAYHRHSEVLVHYGFDLELAHRMGRIEEELRDRAIDPERIIQELWNGGGR